MSTPKRTNRRSINGWNEHWSRSQKQFYYCHTTADKDGKHPTRWDLPEEFPPPQPVARTEDVQFPHPRARHSAAAPAQVSMQAAQLNKELSAFAKKHANLMNASPVLDQPKNVDPRLQSQNRRQQLVEELGFSGRRKDSRSSDHLRGEAHAAGGGYRGQNERDPRPVRRHDGDRRVHNQQGGHGRVTSSSDRKSARDHRERDERDQRGYDQRERDERDQRGYDQRERDERDQRGYDRGHRDHRDQRGRDPHQHGRRGSGRDSSYGRDRERVRDDYSSRSHSGAPRNHGIRRQDDRERRSSVQFGPGSVAIIDSNGTKPTSILKDPNQPSKRPISAADRRAEDAERKAARLTNQIEVQMKKHQQEQRRRGSSSERKDHGNTLLTQLAGGHEKWPLGGIAELIHNAGDAGAKTIRISRHGSGPSVSLRIDDDGCGMAHGVPKKGESGLATGIHKLMQIGADESMGKSKEKAGQVGGYGVGAKIGMMAVAQSAVIFTIGNSAGENGTKIRTVSVAFISNKPFEEHGKMFIKTFVTLDASRGKAVPGVSTDAEKVALFAQIAKVDPTLNDSFFHRWQGQLDSRGCEFGTSVFLIGLRCLKKPATWALTLNDGQSPPDIMVHSVRAHGERVPFNGSLQRREQNPAPLDYSFRHFLAMMFKGKPDLTIELFGKKVRRVAFENTLSHTKRKHITVPGRAKKAPYKISVLVGVDEKEAHPGGQHGVHVYCVGTLIAAYVHHDLKLADFRGEHFGAVLIVDFSKETGIDPINTKINMNWNENPEVWAEIKNVYEEYVDTRRLARDQQFPYRKIFLANIGFMKNKFSECFGVTENGGPRAGPVVGVLRLPPKETGPTAFHAIVNDFLGGKVPKSFEEIEDSISKCLWKKEKAVGVFGRHVNRVLDCALAFHSKRWTADNNLPTAIVSSDELESAQTIPFVTPQKGESGREPTFTIKAILLEKEIPRDFTTVTLQQNQEDFEISSESASLDYGTSILLPHHKDVEAFKFIQKMQGQLQTVLIPAITDDLRSKEKQASAGVDDEWVQCDDCKKWRKISTAAYRKYAPQDAIFLCKKEGRKCTEKCDSNEDDVEVRAKDEGSAPGGSGGGGSGSSGGGGARKAVDSRNPKKPIKPVPREGFARRNSFAKQLPPKPTFVAPPKRKRDHASGGGIGGNPRKHQLPAINRVRNDDDGASTSEDDEPLILRKERLKKVKKSEVQGVSIIAHDDDTLEAIASRIEEQLETGSKKITARDLLRLNKAKLPGLTMKSKLEEGTEIVYDEKGFVCEYCDFDSAYKDEVEKHEKTCMHAAALAPVLADDAAVPGPAFPDSAAAAERGMDQPTSFTNGITSVVEKSSNAGSQEHANAAAVPPHSLTASSATAAAAPAAGPGLKSAPASETTVDDDNGQLSEDDEESVASVRPISIPIENSDSDSDSDSGEDGDGGGGNADQQLRKLLYGKSPQWIKEVDEKQRVWYWHTETKERLWEAAFKKRFGDT